MYAFILGDDPELSKEEVVSYLSSHGIQFKVVDDSKQALIVDADVPHAVVSRLGGTIKLIKILKTFDDFSKSKLKEEMKTIEVEDFFGVSVYGLPGSAQHEIGMAAKDAAKEHGMKSRFFQTRRPFLSAVEVLKKNLQTSEIVGIKCKKFYLGKTAGVYDPFEFKHLDLDRPKQRPIYSMPIRIARMMVNLAGTKPENKVLDPFCGYGTILQEVMLSGAEAHGIDNDPDAVEACKENLQWICNEKNIDARFFVSKGDARHIEGKYDAIVTEPYLGPPLKSAEGSKELLKSLEHLYSDFLKSAAKVLRKQGRLVVVFPSIKSSKINRSIIPQDFKLLKSFIVDKNQIVAREIIILERI